MEQSKLPKYLQKILPVSEGKAFEFLHRFGHDLSGVRILYQPKAKRSRYFPNRVGALPPTVTISCRSGLYLYKRKSLGEYAHYMNVGIEVQVGCALVHEFTHHIQRLEGRPFSEVETTRNELQFLAEHYPKWYKLITKP